MSIHRKIRARENISKREVEIKTVDFPAKMVVDHSPVGMSVSNNIWGFSCPFWSPADRFFPHGDGEKNPALRGWRSYIPTHPIKLQKNPYKYVFVVI